MSRQEKGNPIQEIETIVAALYAAAQAKLPEGVQAAVSSAVRDVRKALVNEHQSQFCMAVAAGKVGQAAELLAIAGVNVNVGAGNHVGQSPLLIAVSSQDRGMVEFLLENGADCQQEIIEESIKWSEISSCHFHDRRLLASMTERKVSPPSILDKARELGNEGIVTLLEKSVTAHSAAI